MDRSGPFMPVNSGISFASGPLPSGDVPQNFNRLASLECKGVVSAASRAFEKAIFLKFAQSSDKRAVKMQAGVNKLD